MSAAKTCNGCGEVKLADAFYSKHNTCKDCRRARGRELYHADVESRRADARERYAANPKSAEYLAKGQEWKDANREHVRALGREYAASRRASDPEASRAYSAAWFASNPERNKEVQRRAAASAQAETLASAERWGAGWAGWELEVISDGARKEKDLALQLGRTVAAVRSMRYQIRHDPQAIERAGLSESGIL